jgi:protein phosphatase 1 regulatory subunit 42
MHSRPLQRRIDSLASLAEEDVFSSVGGLELAQESAEGTGLEGGWGGNALADYAPADGPSRTLLVQNVAPEVSEEELHNLFGQHGQVRLLYSASKHRGLVMVTYYDLRCAISAMAALQRTQLAGQQLLLSYTAQKGGKGDKASAVNQVRGLGE